MIEELLQHYDDVFVIKKHVNGYPVPLSLNYWWSYGFVAGFFFVLQIITGILLAMNYNSSTEYAFDSVEHIMRNVPGGWTFRYMHSNGASMIFLSLYIHIGKAMYYKSYSAPRWAVWGTGLVIFLLVMVTAFVGYVLPWGQMSLWGATVICNLFSTIPYVGESLVFWIWGGYSVEAPTLNRFLSLHYMLPMLTFTGICMHIMILHEYGSSNPTGHTEELHTDFYPYYIVKDFYILYFFLLIFNYLVHFAPNWLGHPENYIRANSLITPPHIVPEWYFLPFYAVLRAIPNKELGVIAMGLSIAVFFLLPFLDTSTIKSPEYRPFFQVFFWMFICNFIFLGYLGSCPASPPYILLAQYCTAYHFAYFIIILPLVGWIEDQCAWYDWGRYTDDDLPEKY